LETPVPVTARLSKLFYERLGEQITNELVDWFNAVDATYRAELRELNEVNYARFDAKLEQRIAELRAEMLAAIADLRAETMGAIADLRAETMGAIGGLRGETMGAIGSLRAEMASLKAELIKWMFVFWAGTALAGLLLR
jgi:uncharacterized small protein (DUF1192 family)